MLEEVYKILVREKGHCFLLITVLLRFIADESKESINEFVPIYQLGYTNSFSPQQLE